ncbi:MAG: metal-transporting ATPase, partial [Calditrichaeota bacterium]|nr:metal-transporting ATPase [Calditrichota bacterium]
METLQTQFDISRVKVREFLDTLKTSFNGLSTAQARSRQAQFGLNEIPEQKPNPLLKFLAYLWGPIPLMIEAAAVLSLLVHHYSDFAIIMMLLIINTAVGYWHDRKADNAIEMLKQKLALRARVFRDRAWRVLPARELVPGDIIRLRLGDIIPADVKLIKGSGLECDESALTGESLPV